MTALSFRVFGEAQAKGSLKSFGFQVKDSAGRLVFRNGKPLIRTVSTHDNPKTKGWQQLVAQAAADAIRTLPAWRVLDGPVRVSLAFYLPRPQSLPKKVVANVRGLDADKLARLVLDAMTSLAYGDDRQVVELIVGKYYAQPQEPAHVDVRVEPTIGVRPSEWPAAPAPLFDQPLFAREVPV